MSGDLFVPGLLGDRLAVLTPHLRVHDAAVANLEGPLTLSRSPITKTGPLHAALPSLAREIAGVGFTAVNLANNHVMDMGERGLLETIEACEAAGLGVVGAGSTEDEARRPLVIEIEGMTVVLLAAAEHEFSVASGDDAGAAGLDIEALASVLSSEHQRPVPKIVLLHAGKEHYPYPSPGLVSTCRALVRTGANCVVCTHAHVSSGIEVFAGAPIVYGTGNLLFSASRQMPQGWYSGYSVSLTLDSEGVSSFELLLHEFREEALVLVTGSDATAPLRAVSQTSTVIADGRRLREEWLRLCSRARIPYLSALLGLSRVERLLLRAGVWPSWKIRRRSLPTLLNLVRCESHAECLRTLLEQEVRCADEESPPC